MDIESISKILHARKGEDAHSTHNFFDFCCLASLALSKDCTLLAMPTQTIKEPSLRLCFPFYKDTRRDRPGNNRVNNSNSKSKSKKNNGSNDNDYRWNNAYQNLKHNKTTSLDKYGNISCLLYTMSALFLLNCRLSNSFIQSGIFCAVDVAEQVCNIPSVGGLIRPELCDADKEYCRNKVKEIECAQQ